MRGAYEGKNEERIRRMSKKNELRQKKKIGRKKYRKKIGKDSQEEVDETKE